MKKLFLALLFAAASAHSATVYQDRFVNTGKPCMIDFEGTLINATMIESVTVGTFQYHNDKWAPWFWNNEVPWIDYQALRVTMVNKMYYQITTGNLDQQRTGFLVKLKACQ